MRKASSELINHIKQAEGFKARAYQDVGGIWTIGYGHTKGVRKGDVISRKAGEMYMLEDLAPIEAFLRAFPEEVDTQGKFDALADFAYNLGLQQLKTSTLWKKVLEKAGTVAIQYQFRRWIYASGKVQGGLVNRRNWEAIRWAEKS